MPKILMGGKSAVKMATPMAMIPAVSSGREPRRGSVAENQSLQALFMIDNGEGYRSCRSLSDGAGSSLTGAIGASAPRLWSFSPRPPHGPHAGVRVRWTDVVRAVGLMGARERASATGELHPQSGQDRLAEQRAAGPGWPSAVRPRASPWRPVTAYAGNSRRSSSRTCRWRARVASAAIVRVLD